MSKRTTKYKGGQQSVDALYTNFLASFGATANMSIDDIQTLFRAQVMKEFNSTIPTNASTNTPVGLKQIQNAQGKVLQDNLIKYVNLITQVQQSLTTQRSNLQQQQSNFNKQRTGEVVYQKLLKDTGNVLAKFDKYLLKYISFIMVNPKKDVLLSNLSTNIQKIIDEHKIALTMDMTSGNQNYSQFLIGTSNDIQNKIMIEVIRSILENTRPIYQEFQNTPITLSTNVPNNTTKKILQNVNKTLQSSTTLQSEFKKNIANWIDLLTEIVKLNSVTILATSLNKTTASHLGDIILDYQTSVTHIQSLFGKVSAPNMAPMFSNKKNSEIFVQELTSEVFRWGMNIFKLYKHSAYLSGSANGTANSNNSTSGTKN